MKLNNLITELLADPEKITRLEAKRLEAESAIRTSLQDVKDVQFLLDHANQTYGRKIKTFQILDTVLAEVKFALRREADQKKKAQKRIKKIGKTVEQTVADVMACLESLPEAQRQAILATMKAQQKGELKA